MMFQIFIDWFGGLIFYQKRSCHMLSDIVVLGP
jgi:hypothetical protein